MSYTRFQIAVYIVTGLLSLGACRTMVKSGSTTVDSSASATLDSTGSGSTDGQSAPAGATAQSDSAARVEATIPPPRNEERRDGNTVTVDSAEAGGVSFEAGGEMVQVKVETAFIMQPGFAGVEVTSTGPGAIVLIGTVASEEERTRAETIAKGVEGVTVVTNKLTVAGR